MYASLCAHGPSTFLHSSLLPTHTVIVPCLSLTFGISQPPLFLPRHVSKGKKSFHHVLAKTGKLMFHGPLFADVEILMDTSEAKVINLNVQEVERERQGFA